ncbi:SpvB/TcaC N-terminal domain-containing protein [Streptomyces sp. NPDC059517]|uniref:SpvB/TcaC N-terminal domain-containing protein n=1 Tax=Streptomyces sp. NPDC059517 TaxID=3346855 RepID=UPI00369EFB47
MGDATQAPDNIISLPQGGGAVRGIGETVVPDLQTGIGNLTVPITVPAGRRRMQPTLSLGYSSGHGNGWLGLGWKLGAPGIARKTRGVPVYDDDVDTFVLSGSEDLVPVDDSAVERRYRPRTEGLFADIVHHRDVSSGQDYWEVTSRDGLCSRYGSRRPGSGAWRDPAVIADPDAPTDIFAWHITETRDLLGNVVVYEYDADTGHTGSHRWRQPLLRRIRYADYPAGHGTTGFLATVTLTDEERPDPFSSYTAGFEIRTTRRYCSIDTAVQADPAQPQQFQPVRRYELKYTSDPYNGFSLLAEVALTGFDEEGTPHRDLPPVTFGYGRFEPAARRFQAVTGADLPSAALSRADHELVDLTGYGLPDVLQLDGVARYWRNLGGGRFDRPRPMAAAPAGLSLAAPGVQLLDADGDGRADLLVTTPALAGYFPLRFGATWGAFRRYRNPPSFGLKDPLVRLMDLDGDGVTDALQTGSRWYCFFADPKGGWRGPRAARPAGEDGPPPLPLADPRVHFADMTGDGLSDLVLINGRTVEYWPNRGHGTWGDRVRMNAASGLPGTSEPGRLLLGDLDGDGLADLVHTGPEGLTIWFNRSGNGWSAPVKVPGVPASGWDVRITDLLGTGTGGVLYSRDNPGTGRPSMYFLDLSGGVKPRLLTEVDNHIGALTRIGYRSSSAFASADSADRRTRWRTALPCIVPVVHTLETIDRISGNKLTTTYTYRHGYWDGLDAEFRGFGCVEQTEKSFADYHASGLHPGTPFTPVPEDSFAAPTLTRTWFHLGPVETDDGRWAELNLSDEYWNGDRQLLGHTSLVEQFLQSLREPGGAPDRRAQRDALRALRGRILRTELYGLDNSGNRDRPYTVTEHSYGLREEPTAHAPDRPRVFFASETAARTTQWECGSDPMTNFTFTDDYDAHGQPRRMTTVAPPRRSSHRRTITVAPVRNGAGRTLQPDETRVLATHTRTQYAQPDSGVPIHDRVAQIRTYELRNPPGVDEQDSDSTGAVLADQLRVAMSVRDTFHGLAGTRVRLIGHELNHYDGEAYQGRDVGGVGPHGLLTRSEHLVFRDGTGDEDTLTAAYGAWRPDYLGGTSEPLPTSAPAGFGTHLGYRHETADPGESGYAAGWYADTARHAYDVQLSKPDSPLPCRGLILGIQDPLDRETRIVPDRYWLLPTTVKDAAGLITTVTYDYRVGKPTRLTDANDNATTYRYHPLGLLAVVVLEGRDGEGGTAQRPELSYTYDLMAYQLHGQPISAHTVARVWHASDLATTIVPADSGDDVIQSREYSDGFGRLLQKRVQADELAFDNDEEAGLLVRDDAGVLRPVPGQANRTAHATHVEDRVAVSVWQSYDNKGRPWQTYEPSFATGWNYSPPTARQRGTAVTSFYDPRGQVVRVLNPDGSQQRTIFGTPADLSTPDTVDPTPWMITRYDENDLAPLSTHPSGGPLTERAPLAHHFTPQTSTFDALGRTLCHIARAGADPVADQHAVQTTYDIHGNTVSVTDELGRTTQQHAYDLTGRPLRTDSIDAGRHTTVTDAAGQLVAARDARGCLTLRTYDTLNRPATVYARDRREDDLTLREQLTYGDSGTPSQPDADRTDARTHNRLGRLWRHLDEAGLITIDHYDFTGNATSQARQPVSDTALAADPVCWTANWASPGAAADLEQRHYVTTTRFDALGRAVEITTPTAASGAPDRVVTPTYARSGGLRSVAVDGVPYVRLLVHNARGQRVLLAYGDGTPEGVGSGPVIRYAYETDTLRLQRLRAERMMPTSDDTWTAEAGPVLQELTYSYDLVGNITAIDERTAGCGVAGTAEGRHALRRDFAYDPLYRMSSASGRACAELGTFRPLKDGPRCGSYPAAPTQNNAPDATVGYRETYTYDPVGNLLNLNHQVTTGRAPPSWRRVFAVADPSPENWAEAANNQLISVHNAGQSVVPLGYDKAGNMITETDTRAYTWDHLGRLASFKISAGRGTSVTARYLYAADGMRVKKWVRRGNEGSLDESTLYLGDSEHHYWKAQDGGHNSLLHVKDGAKRISIVRTGTDVHPDDASPPVRYEIADQLGSAVLSLDHTGAWTNREEYFPYGETSFGSFARKRYRFTGMERDEESGLAYHAARYYMCSIGRWISPDPLAVTAGLRPYSYVRGNPARFEDPSGLQEDETGRGTEQRPRSLEDVQNEQFGPLRRFFGFEEAGKLEDSAPSDDATRFYDARQVRAGAWQDAGETAVATGDALMLAQPAPEAAVDALSVAVLRKVGSAIGKAKGALRRVVSALGHTSGRVAEVAGRVGSHFRAVAPELRQAFREMSTSTNSGFGSAIEDACRILLRSSEATHETRLLRAGAGPLDDLAKFRSELGLPPPGPKSPTLARLDIGGKSFYGWSGRSNVTLKANPVSMKHAEADVFQQAMNAGTSGGPATLYVDYPQGLCLACAGNGGVNAMARQIGLREIQVVGPNFSYPYRVVP